MLSITAQDRFWVLCLDPESQRSLVQLMESGEPHPAKSVVKRFIAMDRIFYLVPLWKVQSQQYLFADQK